MNIHKIAENLFIRAEKLGMDKPSEGMVADAMGDIEANLYNEIIYELISEGFHDAAKCLENNMKLRQLNQQE